jgi:hypothetical protein
VIRSVSGSDLRGKFVDPDAGVQTEVSTPRAEVELLIQSGSEMFQFAILDEKY